MSGSPVAPAKRLGQHFLNNLRVIERIIDAIGPKPGIWVAEIGPGTGALTRHLLARGAHVLAIEMDERCYPTLEALSAEFDGRLTLIKGDALNLTSWLPQLPQGSPICGNLPYNVGTEIVTSLLLAFNDEAVMPAQAGIHVTTPARSAPTIQHSATPALQHSPMTFMLQKEVIQRLTATPGGKDWGRLGVLTHLLADAKRLFDVPPGAFNPPPKVMSSIVRLLPLSGPRFPVNMAKLDLLLRSAFGQRRKMLRASLKGLLTEQQIGNLEIDPTARPETLTTAELVRLAHAFPPDACGLPRPKP